MARRWRPTPSSCPWPPTRCPLLFGAGRQQLGRHLWPSPLGKTSTRSSYAPGARALFLACCGLNFVWSPLRSHRPSCTTTSTATRATASSTRKTTVYVFLVIILSLVIVLLSIEGVVRLVNKYGRILRQLWPLLTCLIAVFCAVFLTTGFISICAQSGGGEEPSYGFRHPNIRSSFLALISFSFIITVLTLVALGLFLLREAVYWEDGRPRLRQKKMKLTIPEFLISQSNVCADNDGAFEPSQSGTPSPSTPKLPTIIVLGRRRHTICQISDSTSTTSTPADPISRAKQYNYVRKFSVDISALQAQLQNPKIFKDAPFQSDIDLTKKAQSEAPKPAIPKPLLPLKPLTLKLDEKEEKERSPTNDIDKKGKESGGLPISPPPPPMITVSNEDALSNHGDADIPNDIHGSKESFHNQTDLNLNTNPVAQKPTSLSFKNIEPSGGDDEHISVPTLESAQSDPSDAECENQKLARLTLLHKVPGVRPLNMLPVFVTEALQALAQRPRVRRTSPHSHAVSTPPSRPSCTPTSWPAATTWCTGPCRSSRPGSGASARAGETASPPSATPRTAPAPASSEMGTNIKAVYFKQKHLNHFLARGLPGNLCQSALPCSGPGW
ncbi:hypothetical protein Btru_053227 [Bulinus truncatus]|nr:hypothetical protein Btru_053227 [Bulinus truncatus]